MKIEEIEKIIKLMAENDLTEFKIEAEDMHLCLKRGGVGIASIQAPVVQQVIPAASAPVSAAPAAPAAATAKPEEKHEVIESPMVGSFYRSSTPGGDPFVSVGTKVSPDTTVCIIEAMKVMNEIKAEKAGVIKEVLLENGQAVEFGQPLFVLE